MKRLLLALFVSFWTLMPAVALGQTTTPNRGLILPEAVPNSWGSQYNENFRELDLSKIPRVTNATKPTAPEVNEVVVVTDAANGTTCTTGGGVSPNICQWNGSAWVVIGGAGGGGGHVVYDETTPEPARSKLRFLGAGVTAADNAGNDSTDVTISGTSFTVSGNAIVVQSTPGNFITRSMGDKANQIIWTNGDGVAGNPTPALANGILDGSYKFAQDGGSTDDYVACPLSISMMTTPAYVDGSTHSFRPNTTNTGSATINLCGLGARPIVRVSAGGVATPLATGALIVGQNVQLSYNATNSTFQMQSISADAAIVGVNAFTQRTFQDQTGVFTWTNADGIAGNPTGKLANNFIDGSARFAADAGSSDDYAACPQSISTMTTPAYVDKSIHGFTANTVNTGAATLNLCGLGSRALVKLIGGVSTPLSTGDILVGQPVLAVFSSAANNFKIISQLASGGGGGTGTPGGSDTQCQFNDGGVFGGDSGCTYNKTTDTLTTVNLVAGDPTTNSVRTVMGGGISGHKTYTQKVNADADYAMSTGTLVSGNGVKVDSNLGLVDGGVRYKTCVIENDMQSATVLANANITGRCPFDVAGTLTEVAVFASGGTPSALLERWRPNGGSTADVLTGALATAASGAYACSKATAVSGIAGITCTNTLQNTTLNAGDVVRVKSATAGGTATWMTIKISVAY